MCSGQEHSAVAPTGGQPTGEAVEAVEAAWRDSAGLCKAIASNIKTIDTITHPPLGFEKAQDLVLESIWRQVSRIFPNAFHRDVISSALRLAFALGYTEAQEAILRKLRMASDGQPVETPQP
jgi:hypothetical protein